MIIVKETLDFYFSHQTLYLILVDHILLDDLNDTYKAEFLFYDKKCFSKGSSTKLFDHMEVIKTSLFYGWFYAYLYLKTKINFFLKLSLIIWIVHSFFKTLHSPFIILVLSAFNLFETNECRDLNLFDRLIFL